MNYESGEALVLSELPADDDFGRGESFTDVLEDLGLTVVRPKNPWDAMMSLAETERGALSFVLIDCGPLRLPEPVKFPNVSSANVGNVFQYTEQLGTPVVIISSQRAITRDRVICLQHPVTSEWLKGMIQRMFPKRRKRAAG